LCALPRRRFALVPGVVLPALVAALVLGIGEASKRSLLDGTTVVAAISLSSVVATADVEQPPATAAAQLEQEYVVHPKRKDENWTTASGSGTVAPYRLSIRWPYMRVQAPTWTLLRFIRAPDLQQPTWLREFLAAARRGPGGPLVTGDPDEDGLQGGRW